MPITEVLTRDDGSAGRVKASRRPSPNRLNYWPADEMNKVLDWVVGASSALGVTAGTTGGSVLQMLRSFSGPRQTRYREFDDFVHATIDGSTVGDVVLSTASGGTVTCVAASSEAGAGIGHLVLATTTTLNSLARCGYARQTLLGTNLPDVRFRFKTPATFADNDFWIGVAESGTGTPSNYVRFRCNASAVMLLEAKSATGGGTGSVSSGQSLVANTWYEGRVQIQSGVANYYINDALIGSISTAAQVPSVAGDVMAPFAASLTSSTGGGSARALRIDWYELDAVRL